MRLEVVWPWPYAMPKIRDIPLGTLRFRGFVCAFNRVRLSRYILPFIHYILKMLAKKGKNELTGDVSWDKYKAVELKIESYVQMRCI